jgi:hypothetical protein
LQNPFSLSIDLEGSLVTPVDGLNMIEILHIKHIIEDEQEMLRSEEPKEFGW